MLATVVIDPADRVAFSGCDIEADTQSRDTEKALSDELFSMAEDRHVIGLKNDKNQYHVLPSSLEISAGGWIEFISLDRRVHTLSFVSDSISPEAHDFLFATDQLHGPPLLELGSSFFVDFRDAPKGRYVFSSSSNGKSVYGIITVRKD